MIIFETERLTVRQYIFDVDAENFFLLNGNEDVMRYIRPAKAREDCDAFLKEIIVSAEKNPGMGRWAAIEKKSNLFVGSFAIIPVDDTDDIQLGFALLPAYWRKGFASELTKAGLDYYFSTTIADHIYAIAEEPNIASQKVLLKNRFVRDGIRPEGEKQLLRFIFRKNSDQNLASIPV
jgi:[ribosomal protein S5]-alanine N-acetyltransferase